jgi:uncharacterized protein (DUF433 family)
MRITVGTITGLVAAGHSWDAILRMYPYLEDGDIAAALAYRISRRIPGSHRRICLQPHPTISD